MADPAFRVDLYQGTAGAYDRFRPRYPDALIADLACAAGADGTGRLLDLACGTGHACFALAGRFGEIWAVDQEPGMIAVASRSAVAAAGAARFRFLTCAVEELVAPAGYFDLVTVGNAFHRLPRTEVAASVIRWLRPGGLLALLWGGEPTRGDASWQRALQAVLERWLRRPGAPERIPAAYESARAARPDQAILAEAGFEIVSRSEYAVRQEWTSDTITGYVASTSVWSAAALGDDAAAFEADLRGALAGAQPDGRLRQDVSFACDLARRPR